MLLLDVWWFGARFMAIRFKVMGIEVMCDTADEALALATKMASAQQKARIEPAQPKVLAPALPPLPPRKTLFDEPAFRARKDGFNSTAATRTFLEVVEREWPEGASGEQLSEALGLKHPKALGGRLALINAKIKELGFEPENVYFVKRDSSTDGKRIWFSGKDCAALLKQLR